MGLANWGRLGLANSSPGPAHQGPAHRSMAKGRSMATGIAALLAGAAAIALLTPSANAQHAAQPATDQQQPEQAQTPEEAALAPAGATLLDQILVISRTGETAIDSWLRSVMSIRSNWNAAWRPHLTKCCWVCLV